MHFCPDELLALIALIPGLQAAVCFCRACVWKLFAKGIKP